jgi:hypothetical protein
MGVSVIFTEWIVRETALPLLLYNITPSLIVGSLQNGSENRRFRGKLADSSRPTVGVSLFYLIDPFCFNSADTASGRL